MRFSTPAAVLTLSALVGSALGATYYPTLLTPTEGEVWVEGESRSVSWDQTVPAWATEAGETIATTAELRMGFLITDTASSTGYGAYWEWDIYDSDDHPIEPTLYGGNNFVNFTVPSYFSTATKVVFGFYGNLTSYSGEVTIEPSA